MLHWMFVLAMLIGVADQPLVEMFRKREHLDALPMLKPLHLCQSFVVKSSFPETFHKEEDACGSIFLHQFERVRVFSA